MQRSIYGLLVITMLTLAASAQDTTAIARYRTMVQADTTNAAANYQLALALVTAKKPIEALPYAVRAIKTQSAYSVAAYSLLGGIYDGSAQPQKAIFFYKEGLKIFPGDQNLWFNLALACFRAKKYNDAEEAATEAIKLDVKHANSQRLYALVAFHQNKRMNALLGLCSFLITEPNSPRADEAYTNIQSILKGGVLKGADIKELTAAEAKETIALNAIITTVINSSEAQKLNGIALLQYQLKSIFNAAGVASAKKASKTFYDKFLAAYFYQLAQRNNVEALARLISKSAEKTGYEKWKQENPVKVAAFDDWVNNTAREILN